MCWVLRLLLLCCRFQKIMQSTGGDGPMNTIKCTPQELHLLRFLLARNAASLRVPRWVEAALMKAASMGAA